MLMSSRNADVTLLTSQQKRFFSWLLQHGCTRKVTAAIVHGTKRKRASVAAKGIDVGIGSK
jgi:hypothetical protein